MTDPKEFESLDQLFRKTFDDLPETPAASGWDTPSQHVWQHVQSQIKPPRSGWSTQTITMLAAFVVALAVGLFLYMSGSEETESPVNQPLVTSERPAVPAIPGAETAAPAPVPTPGNTAAEKTPKKKPNATSEVEKRPADPALKNARAAETGSDESVTHHSPASPIGKKPVSPNSTERRKAELARRAEIAWKTPLSPLPPHWPTLKSKDSPR